LGYSIKGQDRIEEAETEFKKVLKLKCNISDRISAHLALASIYEERGDLKKAKNHYRIAIGYDPTIYSNLKKLQIGRLLNNPLLIDSKKDLTHRKDVMIEYLKQLR